MPENKTKKRDDLSVSDYLAAIENDERRDDCIALVGLMEKLAGSAPYLYGASIVGFGTYHYRYESGHEGDAPVLAFASRKPDLTIYLLGALENPEAQALLNRIGKHKVTKGCLYVRRLGDLDLNVLERLLIWSRDAVKKLYPS